jgi:uncharacterized protein YaaN involved in tellurite resistance
MNALSNTSKATERAAESGIDSIVELNEPSPPGALAPDEASSLQEQAKAIAAELEQTRGSKVLALVDSVSTLGAQEQREAGTELALLRGRVGDMMAREGAGSEIARDLVDLRVTLLQIDPNELSKPGLIRRVFGFLPFVGRTPPPLKVLERISARYGTAASQVQVIETRLNEGRRLLARDNIELRKLYEGVEAQQAPIEKKIYLGELLIGELAALLERTDDPTKQERVRNVLHDVAMRVQDLRTMQAVYSQFYVSIEMTRQNNSRLAQSVERTVSMAGNLVVVGLAIQAALARQKRVLEATQATQEFLGQMLAENAAAIKQHTAEIGDVYNNPIIAIDKIAEAHRDLLAAMVTVDKYRDEGIRAARQNIATLARMSDEMQGKLAALEARDGAAAEG